MQAHLDLFWIGMGRSNRMLICNSLHCFIPWREGSFWDWIEDFGRFGHGKDYLRCRIIDELSLRFVSMMAVSLHEIYACRLTFNIYTWGGSFVSFWCFDWRTASILLSSILSALQTLASLTWSEWLPVDELFYIPIESLCSHCTNGRSVGD